MLRFLWLNIHASLFLRVVFLRFDEELEHEKLLHNSQDPKSNNLPLEDSTKLGKAKLYPTSAPASGTSAVASSQVCYNSSILPMIDGVNQQSKKLQMILCMPLSSLLYTVSLLARLRPFFCKAILSYKSGSNLKNVSSTGLSNQWFGC